jgi:hypothetical protein
MQSRFVMERERQRVQAIAHHLAEFGLSSLSSRFLSLRRSHPLVTSENGKCLICHQGRDRPGTKGDPNDPQPRSKSKTNRLC